MAKAATKIANPAAQKPVAAPPAPRQGHNSGTYFDRDGNPISRKSVGENGKGWSPTPPDGWDYQWIRIYTRGNPDYSEYHDMREAGWRPVPHSAHPMLFPTSDDARLGLTGCIMKSGQLLVERPMGMTLDARAEEHRKARTQITDQMRSHGLSPPDGVRGMDVSRSDVRRGTFAGQGAARDGSHDPRDAFVVSDGPAYEYE